MFEIANTGRAATPARRPRWSASTAPTGNDPAGRPDRRRRRRPVRHDTRRRRGQRRHGVRDRQDRLRGYASTPTTLVSFNGSNGYDPVALIADADGDLFGTTSVGGMYGEGNVFEITASGFVPLAIMGTVANQPVSDSATIDPFAMSRSPTLPSARPRP